MNYLSELVTLDNTVPAVQYLCKKDKRLAKVISMTGKITYKPFTDDPYEFLIHGIIEQMLSVKAGEKIFNRLIDLCSGELTPEKVMKLNENQIRSIGTSSSKVKYIRCVTENVLNGNLNFNELSEMDDITASKKLTSMHGIGNWTAKMYLIFVLNRQNILPYEDITFQNAYKWMYKTDNVTPVSIMKRCKKWEPYSSVASRFLYHAFDMGLTKKEFQL